MGISYQWKAHMLLLCRFAQEILGLMGAFCLEIEFLEGGRAWKLEDTKTWKLVQRDLPNSFSPLTQFFQHVICFAIGINIVQEPTCALRGKLVQWAGFPSPDLLPETVRPFRKLHSTVGCQSNVLLEDLQRVLVRNWSDYFVWRNFILWPSNCWTCLSTSISS